jgi:hypothetical protein
VSSCFDRLTEINMTVDVLDCGDSTLWNGDGSPKPRVMGDYSVTAGDVAIAMLAKAVAS